MAHPGEERLLRYVGGELPSHEAAEIRSHLEACPQCSAEAEELQRTIAECVRYRQEVLQRELPPPPAPWPDLYRQFAEIDAASGRRAPARWWLGPWAPAALALLAMAVLFFRFSRTPSVQASELLKRAAVAAKGYSGKPRKLQIRTKDRRFTRVSGTRIDAEALRPVQALFVAAHYDWQDPLSAAAYQSWRDRLPDRRDTVTETPDGYQLRTTSESNELKDATLKLSAGDLRPLEERFEFRNREWVEIRDLGEDVTPAPPSVAAAKKIPPTEPALKLPEPAASASDELRVLSALHRIGADLGDPVEVAREGGEVVVSGFGLAPGRRREIQEALASYPRVVTRFSESAAKVPAQGSAGSAPVSGDVSELQSKLAERIGGRANFEQIASQVFDLSEPMMSRAYALRRLAEKFPVDVEAQLSPEDEGVLMQLRRDHVEALRQQVAGITRVLAPVFPKMGDPVHSATAAATWQAAVQRLFQSARRTDKLLAMLFGASPAQYTDEQLPAQLESSLADLRARLQERSQ